MRGWVRLPAGGIAWASVYAYYFPGRLPGRGRLRGAAYGGIGAFLISSLLFFRARGANHPEIRVGHAPASGLWGRGLSGGRGALADLAGDCVWGFIVGVLYRRLAYAFVHQ